MRNDGDGAFTNVTAGSGLDQLLTQSIEWVTHDFNNDGRLDILGGGVIMVNLGGLRFAQNSYLPGFGGVGDLNNDGSLDIFGQQGLQSGVPNGYHWLRVVLHGVVSNSEGIGARITVEQSGGEQIREVRSGDGFRFMSSIMPHFGLGDDPVIERVVVRWPSGIVQVVEDVPSDQLVDITEPVSTSLAASPGSNALIAFPNPAADQLWLKGEGIDPTSPVRISDITGRTAAILTLTEGALAIDQLVPGIYTASVLLNGVPEELRFRKE